MLSDIDTNANMGAASYRRAPGDALMSEEADSICRVLAWGDVGVNEMFDMCCLVIPNLSLAKYGAALAELQKIDRIVLNEERNVWHLSPAKVQDAIEEVIVTTNLENPVNQEESPLLQLKVKESSLNSSRVAGRNNIDKLSDVANGLSLWIHEVQEWHIRGEVILREMQDAIYHLQEREKILREALQALNDQV